MYNLMVFPVRRYFNLLVLHYVIKVTPLLLVIKLCYVTALYVVLCHVMLCYIMLQICHVMSCHIMSKATLSTSLFKQDCPYLGILNSALMGC